MNGKKAKILRGVAQSGQEGIPNIEYRYDGLTKRLTDRCTRRRYQLIKRDYKKSVKGATA